jgi:hypothetical protein
VAFGPGHRFNGKLPGPISTEINYPPEIRAAKGQAQLKDGRLLLDKTD